jgi:flagellar hook-basal body complex protein FliE
MTSISFNHAASAYRDANRVAEKILSQVDEGTAPTSSSQAMKPDFTQLLGTSLDKARDAGYTGESMSTKAIIGEAELHDLVTAVANAELTLNTVVAVRDRVIGAYNDIIKMPI